MTTAFVGASGPLLTLDQQIHVAARSAAKVLITGESGVGKDVVARLLHERSGRTGPFVSINCAGVPDALIESELFGHVRGSFTHAYRGTRGRLEEAQHGTIFLDEVGDMSLRMQGLLLRFLENGEVQQIGSVRPHAVRNVRVIAATHRDLPGRIAAGQFREDVYYRLNVIHLAIPPLRERPDDVGPLARYFLELFGVTSHLAPSVISEEALDALTQYHWPGNTRELRNVMERLVVRCRSGVISCGDLAAAMPGMQPILSTTPGRGLRSTVDALYEHLMMGDSFWTVVHAAFTSHDVTRGDVRALVARGLTQTGGSYKELASLFNVAVDDYPRFVGFLEQHDCNVASHTFRTTVASHRAGRNSR
jgi:transcriptional regulator with PAS, ATPase and Fis domain